MNVEQHCVFCFKHRDVAPKLCSSFLMNHEYPEPIKIQQVKKLDMQLCINCNLHPKNPLSKSNGCSHEYLE